MEKLRTQPGRQPKSPSSKLAKALSVVSAFVSFNVMQACTPDPTILDKQAQTDQQTPPNDGYPRVYPAQEKQTEKKTNATNEGKEASEEPGINFSTTPAKDGGLFFSLLTPGKVKNPSSVTIKIQAVDAQGNKIGEPEARSFKTEGSGRVIGKKISLPKGTHRGCGTVTVEGADGSSQTIDFDRIAVPTNEADHDRCPTSVMTETKTAIARAVTQSD